MHDNILLKDLILLISINLSSLTSLIIINLTLSVDVINEKFKLGQILKSVETKIHSKSLMSGLKPLPKKLPEILET